MVPYVSRWSSGRDSRNDSITADNVIGSIISHQLMISQSYQIPQTILLWLNHDPDDPACYVDRCWIRYFITTVGYFTSHISIVRIHKLPGNIHKNMFCLVSTVCIYSKTLTTYTYLSNMACPNHVLSWITQLCIHWTDCDVLVTARINDLATPRMVASWIDVISLTFFVQPQSGNFSSKFPSELFISWFNWQ